MNTAKPGSPKHHSVILRPMPGSRFTIWGADCHLEYAKGKTREQIQWLSNWISNYLTPLADREEEAERLAAETSGEVPTPEMPVATAAAADEYQGPKAITSLPFLKEANGAKQGGFKPEDYEGNR